MITDTHKRSPNLCGGGGGENLPPRQFFFATVQKRLALDC